MTPDPDDDLGELDPLSLKECGRLLRVLSDPVRMRMLALLCDGPLSVTEIADSLGLAHYQASRHLSALHDWQLLRRERQRQRVMYTARSALITSKGGANIVLGCCTLRLAEPIEPVE